MPAPTKVALVTGSGKRRVGSYVAEALAERGYALAIHYRQSAEEAEAQIAALQGRGAIAAGFQADLTSEDAVRGMFAAVAKTFGRLDVLVTCAAIWQRIPLEQMTAADVRRHFEINTLGTLLCAQQAGLDMAKQSEGGVIVTLGEWAVVRPYQDYLAYFASKGAIPTLTRALAVELAARNPRVRVNCIEPGPVMIPADVPAAEREEAINATLVKREGSPQNIAQAVLSLIDNDFITGVSLPVDGGRSIYAG
jgi:pteridine reductase